MNGILYCLKLYVAGMRSTLNGPKVKWKFSRLGADSGR